MGIPGYSLYRELELYVEGGLTPQEALQTATIIPARVLKRDAFSGSLAVGKDADLIIVDGDPLHDIHDIRKVQTVIKGDKIYDPGQLHQMVGFK
jgi:imidazolonepropionase-like amidohydrolase